MRLTESCLYGTLHTLNARKIPDKLQVIVQHGKKQWVWIAHLVLHLRCIQRSICLIMCWSVCCELSNNDTNTTKAQPQVTRNEALLTGLRTLKLVLCWQNCETSKFIVKADCSNSLSCFTSSSVAKFVNNSFTEYVLRNMQFEQTGGMQAIFLC